MAGGDAPAVGEAVAPGEAAGGLAAELVVVVATQAGLQVVRAEPPLVLRERGAIAARRVEAGERAIDAAAVAQPVETGGQHLAVGDDEVALQAGAVAAGFEAIHVGRAEMVVGGIDVAADGQAQAQRLARAVAHAAADHLLQHLRIVGQAPGRIGIEEVVAARAQALRLELPCLARGEVRAQRNVVVAVAVAVRIGIVHAAAGVPGRADAAAGIDAVGGLVAEVEADAAARAAQIEAGGGFAQAVAAGADARATAHAGVSFAATGEHLDHPADRIGAVQGGTRAAHDLDALDLLQREVLQRGEARRGRTHAHAIDQEQRVIGFGAAQEQGAELAQAALVDQGHAGAAAQQFRQ